MSALFRFCAANEPLDGSRTAPDHTPPYRGVTEPPTDPPPRERSVNGAVLLSRRRAVLH